MAALEGAVDPSEDDELTLDQIRRFAASRRQHPNYLRLYNVATQAWTAERWMAGLVLASGGRSGATGQAVDD